MLTISNDTVPPWPSLYNPGVEVLHIQHQPAVQPRGKYLYQADGMYILRTFLQVFTFYRYLSFHVILDNNILHPTLPDLRLLCILELCISTVSSCLRAYDHDKRRPNVCLGLGFT